jgi:predicted CDP-diglyceride synthetase/phosphatidate cytidylyltransferase
MLVICLTNQSIWRSIYFVILKEKLKLDDTGNFLPGHGGLLDRVDGVIFVIPAAYLIDKIFFNVKKKNCNTRINRFNWKNIN